MQLPEGIESMTPIQLLQWHSDMASKAKKRSEQAFLAGKRDAAELSLRVAQQHTAEAEHHLRDFEQRNF
jgi:hypothetical protein